MLHLNAMLKSCCRTFLGMCEASNISMACKSSCGIYVDRQFAIAVMSIESMSECTLVFRIQRYDIHV